MYVALSLLLAVACLLPGSGKLLAHPRMRKAAAHFSHPLVRLPWLIGIAELAAAAGVLMAAYGGTHWALPQPLA